MPCVKVGAALTTHNADALNAWTASIVGLNGAVNAHHAASPEADAHALVGGLVKMRFAWC